jgi:NADH-quinone oxidoreductase subunit L
MATTFDYVAAIALLPLASFAIALLVGNYMPKKGALAGILATGGSLLLSLWAFLTVSDGQYYQETLYTWVTGVGDGVFDLTFGVLIDPLSALMLVVVSLVSFLVHVFSLGYMNDEGETGLPRYYAELGLFSFSMLAFVMADNLVMAFMFFELVGLCSYLLIGFWFRTRSAASAAKKAFLVTRFGDYFFLVGVVAVFATFGTAAFAGEGSFPELARAALDGGAAEVTTFGFEPQLWFTIVGLLVLGGVLGKSAQFPLHTWLPDAMEGPTTVSALIHAATMVAAGVYLVARMFAFYALSPTALAIIAFVGGFTALFAATMGVVKSDVKQVLAYSTISQYGYMMLGLGVGGYVAGVFHLMNHAFFKALLFLGAGSVIVAMHHEQDMWEMGGLKKHLPVTYWTFVAGSLALAGIIPFSGFWSKDEVLYEALAHGLGGSTLLLAAYAMGLVAVFFTGFYTFRMVFLTFHGEPRTDAARDPHGVGWSIKAPLVVLGLLATFVGLVNMTPLAEFGIHVEYLHEWLAPEVENGVVATTTYANLETIVHDVAHIEAADLSPLVPGALSLVLALSGAGLAWRLYNVPEPVEHTDRLGSVKTLVVNNYYQDEYQVWLAEGLTASVARAADKFDAGIVDGVVNAISSVSLYVGSRVKRIQSGVVSNNAALLTASLVVLVLLVAILGGWF